MTKWLLLGGAIVSEIAGSLSLKAALDHPALYAVVAVGYLTAFTLLALTLLALTLLALTLHKSLGGRSLFMMLPFE